MSSHKSDQKAQRLKLSSGFSLMRYPHLIADNILGRFAQAWAYSGLERQQKLHRGSGYKLHHRIDG